MMRQLTRILSVATVLMVVVAPAATAQEVNAETALPSFGIRPAVASAADPASFGYFVHTLERGQRFTDQALVVNEGIEPVTLEVYVAASRTAINGSTSFLTYGAEPQGAASWITLEDTEVALDPGEAQLVSFTVDVPPDASPGEHVAGLIVQPSRAGTAAGAEAMDASGPTFEVEVVRRVGVAVVVSVPGERSMSLRATDIRLDHQHERGAVFALRVQNTGNLMVEGTGTLEVANAAGSELATIDFDMATVLPRDEGLFYIDHPALLGDGRFALRATVEYRPVRGTEDPRITSVSNDAIDVREGQPTAPEQRQPGSGGDREIEVLESAPGPVDPRGGPGPLSVGLGVSLTILAVGAFLAIVWTRKPTEERET